MFVMICLIWEKVFVTWLVAVLQTTASEATFVCLLAGRTEAISRYKKTCPDLDDAEINSRLVAYCSDQVSNRRPLP